MLARGLIYAVFYIFYVAVTKHFVLLKRKLICIDRSRENATNKGYILIIILYNRQMTF